MRSNPTLLAACAVLALCGASGCSKSKPGAATPPASAMGTPAGAGLLQGTVVETLAAPPYTYLRLKTAQGEAWAAVPAADVKVGAPVTVSISLRMPKFESPSLHRTFDNLVMGNLGGAAPAEGAMPSAAVPAGHPGSGAPSAPEAPDEKVAKATGAGACTVEEVLNQRKALANRTITVRGKVVKYKEGIMGKTWIHLRDGSGSAAAGTNDLTVSTQDKAKAGDIVTVKGIVHVDRDLGMGYVYPVILEDSKLIK